MVAFRTCQNSDPMAQESERTMRRKRFQRGSLSARKHVRARVWVAQWWENSTRRSKVLGRCVQMSQSEAQTALAAILRPINEGTAPATLPALTFEEFIDQVYLPHCKRTWKASTELTMVPIINNHLVPAFSHRLLTTITRQEMQDLLESKACVLSKNVVAHLRWYLNAVFKLAWSDGLVEHNPAAELRVPKRCKAGREMRLLSEEEVEQYLAPLELQERLMARLAIFEGLRPGEILALPWGAFDGDAVRINQRVYQGAFDTPKNGKQRESALSDGTISLLQTWRGVARFNSPDALVFPSENPTSPLDMSNLWRRAFKPRLEKIGLEWATFQVLRKTNATLSKKAGVDAKVSADQRGHGLGVSMEVYTISDRQQKREAVKRLEKMINSAQKMSA